MRDRDTAVARRRISALAAAVLGAFLVIVGQLWYLQVLEGSRFSQLSENNRIRVRPLPAPRGALYDRNGLPLAETHPAFVLSIVPREVDDRESTLARLSFLLKVPLAELREAMAGTSADSPWPVQIRRGLTFEDVVRIEERRAELPGVLVEVEPRRAYPASRSAVHLLGYVREATRAQVRAGRYRAGELAGQSGLERVLDEFLRGRDGGEYVEVDTLGRPVRVIRREEPRPGASVVTTLDRRLQEAAESALGGVPGAVIIMDPRNGDLLAMVSSPAFDLTPFERLPCPPALEIGNRTFRNWKDEDLGALDLRGAIVTSCNTFFYQLGLKVGIQRLTRYAEIFGFGDPTGIAILVERGGMGGQVAAPIARRIFEEIYRGRLRGSERPA